MNLSCPYIFASSSTVPNAEKVDDGIGSHAMSHCMILIGRTVKSQRHIGHLVGTVAGDVPCSLSNPVVTRSQ